VTEARTQATEPIDSEQTTVRKEKRARLLARGRGILAASVGGGVHREYDH